MTSLLRSIRPSSHCIAFHNSTILPRFVSTSPNQFVTPRKAKVGRRWSLYETFGALGPETPWPNDQTSKEQNIKSTQTSPELPFSRVNWAAQVDFRLKNLLPATQEDLPAFEVVKPQWQKLTSYFSSRWVSLFFLLNGFALDFKDRDRHSIRSTDLVCFILFNIPTKQLRQLVNLMGLAGLDSKSSMQFTLGHFHSLHSPRVFTLARLLQTKLER